MRAQLTASAGSKASAIRFSDNAGAPIETSPAFTPEGTLVPGADNWACLGTTPPRGGKGPVVSSAALAADGTPVTASTGGVAYAFHDSKTAPPTDPNSLSKTWWGQFQVAGREGQVVAVLVQKGADVAGLVRLKSGLRRGPSGKIQGQDCKGRPIQGTFKLAP